MSRSFATLLRHMDIIWTLTWMNFLPRNPREGFKLLWVIAEPAGQLVVMIMIFTLIGRPAGYGNSFALFLLTGIVMLSLYSTGTQMVMAGVVAYRSKARLPVISILHTPVAQILFKVIVAIFYTIILMAGLAYIQGVEVVPYHFRAAIGAFFWTGLLAFGVGLIRAYWVIFYNPLNKIYGILSRGLIFVSGVFFVPSFMPPQLRDLLAFNPLLHGIELLRLGVYDQYPTIVYSAPYLQTWALGTTALGVTLLWAKQNAFAK